MAISRNNAGLGIAVFAITLTALLITSGWGERLVTSNGFIPHGHCYLWQPGLVWLHGITDSLIALAYTAISGTLAYLVYKTRQEIPFHWMFLAFGTFIVACGSTHFMDVWTLWHPNYWLSGFLKLITAIASVTTAIVLPFVIPRIRTLVDTAKLSEERRVHLENANHQLAAVNEKLKQVDQLKTQFFANVSHELRTPLSLILGPTDRLLQSPDISEEQHYLLGLIHRNGRLLLKQVNDLLDVAKLEAGQVTLTPTQMDLAQLVQVTVANFEGLAAEKGINFRVHAPQELTAQVDREKVQRILLNLLSNAFKFTPNGGQIHCVLTHRAEESQDGATPIPDTVILSVRDSGPGVPIALRDTIFERFSQGEASATRRFGGTGLGLAIAKEFVELHGGHIQVGDAPEGGAQFTVELPRLALDEGGSSSIPAPGPGEDISDLILEELQVTTPASAAVLPPPRDLQSDDRPLVLVVEDNGEMSQFIVTTLGAGYRTATAANGQEGLEQALALRPDLILSDVMMPRLSGDQLVEQLRTHPDLDAIPVLVLTARAEDDLRVNLLRQGAQDYLMKPFSGEELQARVSNLVAIKRVRDRLQQEVDSQSHDLEALVKEVSRQRQELQVALATLQYQAKELEQANQLKNQFLAVVSHELRTPLNSILGWAKLLQMRTLDPMTTARALETIERNAQLQTQMIEDLLDVSRLLQGTLSLHKHRVNLPEILEAALETIRPAAESKGITVNLHIGEEAHAVSGDRDRLQQVIENLLSNAVKFTPAGGEVTISLAGDNTEVTLTVQDTGEGISPSTLPHIFDCFRQSDSSNTRQHGGLGLGLAIVHQLVQLHQGQVLAESGGEGQGATFTVVLPLLAPSSQPQLVLA
jgi:signal transduction histidine kinase